MDGLSLAIRWAKTILRLSLLKEQDLSSTPSRAKAVLTQLSHFNGEIAIFKKSFLRSVSKSPKMIENPAW
jgi:hypothetical protein